MPEDPIVIEVFTLRREIESLRADLRAAHRKISKALETLHAMRRFIRLGLFEKQWNTYDELKHRLSAIEGTLAALDDPVWGVNEKV